MPSPKREAPPINLTPELKKYDFSQLGGRVTYLRRLVDREDKNWSAFNPSIAVNNKGKFAVTMRSSNYVILEHGELFVTSGGTIKNNVWFAELTDDLQLDGLRKLDFSAAGIVIERGVEDAKLMWRDGKWMFMGVMLEKHTPVARNCICYMDKNAQRVTKIDVLPGVESKMPEKNWMTPYVPSKNFDYIYDGTGIVKDGQIIRRLRDSEDLNKLRGNGLLLEYENGTYLGVMHTLKIKRWQQFSQRSMSPIEYVIKDYDHYFVRFDEYGWAIEISDPFHFVTNGIEFANGIVPHNDNYVISFGRDDIYSLLATVSKENVRRLMKRAR
jgi:hypothetical protein